MGASADALAEEDGLPFCRVQRNGGPLVVILRTQGLLAAGGRFEVIPVSGPVPPVREEQWAMTVGKDGIDDHRMKTPVKHLEGDGINFMIRLCTLHPQFSSGALEVFVEQDGQAREIHPRMLFEFDDVAPCQSATDKLTPTVITGGFAIRFA